MKQPTVPQSSGRLTQLALVAGAVLAVAILLLAAAVIVLAGRLSLTRQELASARERARRLEAQLAILAGQIVPSERATEVPPGGVVATTCSSTKPGARRNPAAPD